MSGMSGQAIVKALEFMNDGYHWVVDIALEKFFDNVSFALFLSLVGCRSEYLDAFLTLSINIPPFLQQYQKYIC